MRSLKPQNRLSRFQQRIKEAINRFNTQIFGNHLFKMAHVERCYGQIRLDDSTAGVKGERSLQAIFNSFPFRE